MTFNRQEQHLEMTASQDSKTSVKRCFAAKEIGTASTCLESRTVAYVSTCSIQGVGCLTRGVWHSRERCPAKSYVLLYAVFGPISCGKRTAVSEVLCEKKNQEYEGLVAHIIHVIVCQGLKKILWESLIVFRAFAPLYEERLQERFSVC